MSTAGSSLQPPEGLPPHDLHAEQALLGTLLANNSSFHRMSAFLAAEHFADPVNGRIYELIERRVKASKLADAVTLTAQLEDADARSEINPVYLNQLLALVVSATKAEEFARAVYDAWLRRGLLNQYSTIVGAELDAAGSQWIVNGGEFVIDRATTPTDQSAATNPLRQQLQIAICNAAAELADVASRISNTRTWGRMAVTAKALHDLLAVDPLTVPSHLGETYAVMLRLGRYLDTDIRVQRGAATLDDPLDPDIQGLLTDVVQIAAPWLRGFPTVAAWDDEAARALVRADLFEPARDFTRIARDHRVISERDSSEVRLLAETADAIDYQGRKAGNRAVGSAKNLLLAAAGTVAAFLSGAVASDFATRSLLVQRAGTALAAAESQVEAFAATFPNDLRQALSALVKAGRESNKVIAIIPNVSDLSRPANIEEQARAMILDGRAPPVEWRPHIHRLNFGQTSFEDLNLLADLTALQGLSVRNTTVTDLSPLSHLIALQSLNLISTQVSDLSALSNLTRMRSLYLRGTKVSDLSILPRLNVLLNLNLSSTAVDDLSPLSGLINLQLLYLMNTRVSDASPLAGLTALIALSLRDTKVSDISPLSRLISLQRLYLQRTPVSDVSPLAGLTSLQRLDLRGAKVNDISSLSHLHGLKVSLSDDVSTMHKS